MKSKFVLFLCLFFIYVFMSCEGEPVYDPLKVRIVTDSSAWDTGIPVHESTVTIQADGEKTLYACIFFDKIWTDGHNIEPKPTFQWYYDGKKLDYEHWSLLNIKGPGSTEPDYNYISVENGKKIKVIVNWEPQTGSAETTIVIQQ